MARHDRVGLTRTEGRKFGLTVGVAFLALGTILMWRGRQTAALVVLAVGGLLVLAGLAIPGRLGPVQRGWMAMAHAIGRVTTPVFMSLVYLVVLTPAGLLRRTIGQNPLRHEIEEGGYWKRVDPDRHSDLRRQF